MIIECKEKPTGYEPVKGNEKKIVIHVLRHNYYDNIFWESDVPRDKSRIYLMKFKGEWEGTLILKMRDFFKLNDDGSISKFRGELPSTEYVAVELNFNDDFPWGNWVLNASNVLVICKHDLKPNPYRRDLQIGAFYPVNEGDILIFEKEAKTLIEVLPRTSSDMIDVLQENGYYITKKALGSEE